jgi:hypothetical protein
MDDVEVLPQNLSGGTKENREDLSQERRCPRWDSNQEPPEDDFGALLVRQAAQR